MGIVVISIVSLRKGHPITRERLPQFRGGVSDCIPADQSLARLRREPAKAANSWNSIFCGGPRQATDREVHKAIAVGATIGSKGCIFALIRDGLWTADFMP